MISLRVKNAPTQDINKQMLLLEDCVVEDINLTRASETNIYILLNFLLRYHCA